jgi:hypothetical protein
MATATYITRIPHSRRDLHPDERLELSTLRAQVLAVEYGVVYAAVGENDYVLTSGDDIEIAAGQPVRAWNAGDEYARVSMTARAQELAAAA